MRAANGDVSNPFALHVAGGAVLEKKTVRDIAAGLNRIGGKHLHDDFYDIPVLYSGLFVLGEVS